jgi:RNA polymerase sigma factor (sigma-70 family)
MKTGTLDNGNLLKVIDDDACIQGAFYARRPEEVAGIRHEFFPYLYSMARFKVFDRLKKKQLSEKQIQAWTLVMQEEAVLTAAFHEEELASREALVSSELAQLPSQMKRVYLLSAEQGKSIREISEELLVSPYTVKNHL